MAYKLIFFGSPQNAADLLSKLDKDTRFEVVAVVTQPDRPIGRKQTPTPTPVAQYAELNNIITLKPLRHPQRKHLLKNPRRLKKNLENLTPNYQTPHPAGCGANLPNFPDFPNFPDLLLSYEFGQLIPPAILSLPRLGGLNIHFSLLPSYRGAAPLSWQIANGETQTGISVVKMSAKFDEGTIIYQESHPIQSTDTTQTLHQRLSTRVLTILPDILANYASTEKRLALKTPEPSYYPRLNRQHGYVPWDDFLLACGLKTPGVSGVLRTLPGVEKKAVEIERKIRAFSPWPGVWTTINSKFKTQNSKLVGKRLKILEAKLEDNKLKPQKIQLEGEKVKTWKEFSKQTLLLTLDGKQNINQLHNSNG